MHKWSLKLGRYAGIDVYVHWTFLLLLGVFAFIPSGMGVALLAAIFGCVLLHEYGHALAARQFGIPTHDITLYPIGGVARLARMPDNPVQELWVAAAGPLVNVAIAVLLFAGMAVWEWCRALFHWDERMFAFFIGNLLVANISLVVFNLLPAFPMDGGRILRALLAMKMNQARATRIAATIGQAMAVLFAVGGLFLNPMLLFIGFFVWVGAEQEARAAEAKDDLHGVPVGQACRTSLHVLDPDTSLGLAAKLMVQTAQSDFPVLEGEKYIGMVSREDIFKAITTFGPDAPVEVATRHDAATVDAAAPLEDVVPALAQSWRAVPTMRSGRIVGLLTPEALAEFMMVRRNLPTRPA